VRAHPALRQFLTLLSQCPGRRRIFLKIIVNGPGQNFSINCDAIGDSTIAISIQCFAICKCTISDRTVVVPWPRKFRDGISIEPSAASPYTVSVGNATTSPPRKSLIRLRESSPDSDPNYCSRVSLACHRPLGFRWISVHSDRETISVLTSQFRRQYRFRLFLSKTLQIFPNLFVGQRQDSCGQRAAFFAPAEPIANVPTGIPPGICAVERKRVQTMQGRRLNWHAKHGNQVCACNDARPDAPRRRLPRSSLQNPTISCFTRELGRGVRRPHAPTKHRLVWDVQLHQGISRNRTSIPVRRTSHDHSNER
jgi:hypothetical protein